MDNEPVESIPYTVINREEFLDYKVSYDLRVDLVNGRLPTRRELAATSVRIRSKETGYRRVFICFYLPDMEVDTGAFATAHWTPKPQPIRINRSFLPAQYRNLQGPTDDGS